MTLRVPDINEVRVSESKKKIREEGDALDESFGFQRYCVTNGNKESRRGWIFNMIATVSTDAWMLPFH